MVVDVDLKNIKFIHNIGHFEKGSLEIEDQGNRRVLVGKLKPRFRKKGKNYRVIGVCR